MRQLQKEFRAGAATGRRGVPDAQSRHSASTSARGDYSARKCLICPNPLPPQHMGRPIEYCSPECSEAMRALRRLEKAVAAVEHPSALRSLIVAEVLNRLPVDREALSKRAREQVRGPGGRFQ